MITIRGKQYELVEAHTHVWKEFKGQRYGDTPVETIGNGKVRQGDKVFQFLPPEYQDYAVRFEVLEGYMDMLGMDRAVILQNPCYGDQREYVRDIVRREPDKFRGIGMIDPRNIDTLAQEIDTLIKDYECIGVKMEIPDVPFIMDAPEYDFMWRKIIENNAVAVIDLGWGDGPYDFNIDRMTNVVKRYPEMKIMLPHLGVSRLWDLSQEKPFPELQKTLALLDINKDNLYLDLSAIPVYDSNDEYPFVRGQEILRTVKESVGMDRIMWGSDFPSVLMHCTYQQTLDMVTRHCTFLSEHDLEMVLSKNAIKFLFS